MNTFYPAILISLYSEEEFDLPNNLISCLMLKFLVFVYISASSYIHINYIFLESTYNTDSYSKISAVGNNFEKKIKN